MDRHQPTLDGVRGLAILFVVVFHVAPQWFPGASIGVDLFFTLSAFLITSLIVREFDESGRFSFTRFYLRRAARLLPALVVMLAVVSPVSAIAHHEAGGMFSSTVASLFYFSDFTGAGVIPHIGAPVEGYGHTWSLSVEEQFYLIWPVVLLAVLRRRPWPPYAGRVAIAAAFALAAAAFPLVTKIAGLGPAYFLPSAHLLPFVFGIALCIGSWRVDSRWMRVLISVTSVALLAVTTLTMLEGTTSDWNWLLRYLGASAGCGLLLLAALAPLPIMRRALALPALRWFGTRSYGIYLYHTAMLGVLSAFSDRVGYAPGHVITLGAALALSECSFRWIESPIRRRVRALTESSETRRATLTPTLRTDAYEHNG